MPTHLEGDLVVNGHRFALVVGRFNEHITEKLLDGALDTLERHGADRDDDVTVVHVPGSWEIPVAAQKCARSGTYDAVICLGAVIRGETPHFDYVCSGATSGTMQTALDTDVPVLFGILTTDTVDQAIARAGSKAGNKGREAAEAAIEMATLMPKLDGEHRASQ
ncbi:MAG: 6,7-dimethyl-8-ribityllumazine synthase [Salinibacter sp.]|uniref:6,7-dimethyl-8-ribityllumazine synthase n=1 Tax=Salinibacter sp. TaxID=2065818 RepID=UPI002FC39317